MLHDTFNQIKRQNGEAFAQAIRRYDCGIFDVPDIVSIVQYAGREAEPLLQYLSSLKNVQIEDIPVTEDPIQLLKKAGYNAFYVHTLEEQNSIAKYFAPDEKLCTFKDPTRFQEYHIIHAVKENADQLDRKAFKGKERREDPYAKSVISIQVLKSGGFISIKNRYNHTVENPDNTFFSNPDLIIRGLSASIKKYYDVDFSSRSCALPSGFVLINGQIVRFNYERENIYFGNNFYVKNGIIVNLQKDTEIMLSTCILNVTKKTLYDPSILTQPLGIKDANPNDGTFIGILANELKNKKITITKNADGSHNIHANGITIAITDYGNLVSLTLPTVKTILSPDFALQRHKKLRIFNAPKLIKLGNECISYCDSLTSVHMPKLTYMGNNCLRGCLSLKEILLPCLISTGHDCLSMCHSLTKVLLPNLTNLGDGSLQQCYYMTEAQLPKLINMGNNCFLNCFSLTNAQVPNVNTIGESCFSFCYLLPKIHFPHLTKIGNKCFRKCNVLTHIYAPRLTNPPQDIEKFLDQQYPDQLIRHIKELPITAVSQNALVRS